MTDDLIKRLQDWVPAEAPPEGRTAPDAVADMRQAADRIEALTAENEWWKQFARNVERAAAHGLAGDASIALNEIKREAGLALEKQP